MLCKSTRLYRANGSHSHQRLSVVRPSAAGGRRGGRRRVDGRRGVGEALRPLGSARLTATVDGVPGPPTAFGRRRRLVRSGATSIHPDHMDRWTRPANKVVVPLSDPPLQSSTLLLLDRPRAEDSTTLDFQKYYYEIFSISGTKFFPCLSSFNSS